MLGATEGIPNPACGDHDSAHPYPAGCTQPCGHPSAGSEEFLDLSVWDSKAEGVQEADCIHLPFYILPCVVKERLNM